MGIRAGIPIFGTGLFPEAARLILEFAFDTLGVHRLEARAAVPNGRGQRALAKVCAIHEVNLRQSFYRHGIWFDQVMWSIMEHDRREHEKTAAGECEPATKFTPDC